MLMSHGHPFMTSFLVLPHRTDIDVILLLMKKYYEVRRSWAQMILQGVWQRSCMKLVQFR